MTQEGKVKRQLRPVYLGALAAILVILLAYILTVRLGGVPTTSIARPESPVYIADIFGNNTVGQSFRASHDGLCRVDLRLRPALGDCQVAFRLWEEGHEAEPLGGQFPCPQDESTWYTVRFSRIASSQNAIFHWEVGLAEPSTGFVVSLEATADNIHPDSMLHINRHATATDAVFVPYYCTAKLARPLFVEWLKWNHETLVEWLNQEHRVLTTDRLLALTVVMALVLAALLALPPREQPLRLRFPTLPLLSREQCAKVRPLTWALLAAGLCIMGVMLLMAIQMRVWSRAAVHLRPVGTTSIGPAEGPWVAYDFVANLSATETVIDTPEDWYVAPDWLALGPDRRPVLRMHPPSHVYYTVEVPPGAWLHAAAAMNPEVWQPDQGDGVLFIVRTIVDGVEETVYYQEIDPKNRPDDRRWHDFDVDLSPYAGRTITVLFITYPLETNDWDWSVWGMPVLLTSSKPERTVP
jgi:hypothetical protein